MKRKTEYETLCNLWEKMQTSNKPEVLVNEANAIVADYMLKNQFIAPQMWPLIDFFEQANTVIKSKKLPVTQTEVTQ
jgi:hypothetical protein